MTENGSSDEHAQDSSPSRTHRSVFLSYRRTSFAWALAIFKDLTANGYDVFIDYEGITSGDFAQIITENIRSRAHFVLLLTPSALDRCDDPEDWLRREIETALTSQRNIVPVMLDNFEFNPSVVEHLPEELELLPKYQGLRVPNDFFDAAMKRLREQYLSEPLATILHPASRRAQDVAHTQQQVAAGGKRTAPGTDDRSLFSLSMSFRKYRVSFSIAATVALAMTGYFATEGLRSGMEPPVTAPSEQPAVPPKAEPSIPPPTVTPPQLKPIELEVVLDKKGELRGRERTSVGVGRDGVVTSIAVRFLHDEPGVVLKREFSALARTGGDDPGGPVMYAYRTEKGDAKEPEEFPMGVRGVKFWLEGERASQYVVRYRVQLSAGAPTSGSDGSEAGDWSPRTASTQHQLQWLWLSIEPK